MLKFTLFKLYKNEELSFPPIRAEDNTNNKLSFQREYLSGFQISKVVTNNKGLLNGLKFFISREVSKEIFEFLIKSQGGLCYYDPLNFESELFKQGDFTHIVVDRPIDHLKMTNKDIVQP